MKSEVLQINWHSREPVFSVDFQQTTNKLATCGGDSTARVSQLLHQLIKMNNKIKSTDLDVKRR